MKAIIMGAGNAGAVLAARLAAEKFDAVVIDTDAGKLARLSENFDVMTLEGNGADPETLARAGIENAAILLAVTNHDEANILACNFARNAGVRHRVARIQNPALLHGAGLADLSVLGVDLAIAPASECAAEMAALLLSPMALEVARLFDGLVVAAALQIPPDARHLGVPLGQYPNPGVLRDVRIIALARGGELHIPGGETCLASGDLVAVAGAHAHINALAADLLPGRAPIRKVVIAGGGHIGLALARLLERADQFGTVLLERDPAVAERCAGVLRQTLVLCGDMLSGEFLQTAGITRETAFVSTFPDNEDTLIGALLARKIGASFTLGRVSKLEYLPIIRQVGLHDRAVNPYLSMNDAILHFIRGAHAACVSSFQTLAGEFHEVTLTTKSPLAGVPLRGAKLPRGLIVASILRNGGVITPCGDTVPEPGDRAAIFGLPGAARKIAALFPF